MATIKEMLEIGGTFDGAEKIALSLIDSGRKEFIMDLQLLYAAQGKMDLVKKWEHEADKFLPFCERRAFNRAWHYMQEGNLELAMDCLFISRRQRLFGSPFPNIQANLWDMTSSLEGKRLLLFGEGGLGDEIINVRFAKNFKELGAKTIVSCNCHLLNLFSTVDGVDSIIDVRAIDMTYADYFVPAMSAPLFLKLSYENLPKKPYIKIKENVAWNYIIPKDSYNIGIRWAGNPQFEHEQFRKFPVELMFNLSKIPGVKLYSLQRDNDMVDLPSDITDLSSMIYTWEDTACAVNKMDLIITSCTSVAHLSAAMGQKTWIPVPVMPYYLWARNETDWYSNVKLFRQKTFGFWDDTFAEIYKELEKIVKK